MGGATINWKLTLSYNGSGFHGWQVQPGLVTVQGTLSSALHRLTGEHILPQGSGRTDAGVHALAQVCSFPLSAPLPAANLQRALNRILPAGIRILSAQPVLHTFHARHSARGKTYEYRLFERRLRPLASAPAEERICSPFLAPFAWDCRWPLQLDLMQHAAALLCGTHDFTSMAATDPDKSTRDPDTADAPSTRANPIRTILSSSWSRHPLVDPGTPIPSTPTSATPTSGTLASETPPSPTSTAPDTLLVFRVTGTGFLHHMVRNLVGTLVEIGRGSLQVDDLPRILAARDRSAAGPTAPACGLFLVEVHYDPAAFTEAAPQ
ncbi:MAG TPA: tRNA pseudouridine synthase A [Acidobacteriaceae bacterium]|nr:tRNA pseudouridine synthase A [Acidobacteriaceae bacterium]